MPRGACSGEIIAGVEPVETTKRAIDYITSVGAFPTVCIFRPVIGSDMENVPSPAYEDMVDVMRHMYVACRRHRIPIGVAPNIEVSLIVNPDDAQYLVPRTLGFRLDRLKLAMIKRLAAVKFRRELRPHPVKGTLDPAPRAAAQSRSGMILGGGAPPDDPRLRAVFDVLARAAGGVRLGPGPRGTRRAVRERGPRGARTAPGSRRSRRTERARRVRLQGQPGARSRTTGSRTGPR